MGEQAGVIAHTHGPAEGRGLDCPETLIEGRLRGACTLARAWRQGWDDRDDHDPNGCVATPADVACPNPYDGDLHEVITLCGSTKFKDDFHAENQRLAMAGYVVISLGVYGHTDLPDYDWTTDASDLKRTLDELHFQKIRMADRIHVVDPGGYVGESTRREIAYAESLGLPVTYMSAERPIRPGETP